MKNPFTIFLTLLLLAVFAMPQQYHAFAKTAPIKTTAHSKATNTKKKTVSAKKTPKAKTVKKVTAAKVATVPAVTVTPPTALYTLTTVALHNTAASCWTTISGSVYDFTPWIKQHAGTQQAMLSLCGTDSTAAFNAEYAGKAKPTEQLKAFLIGNLQ